MQRDTIVRVYSMSKVLTSVAVMQLIEEARVGLDDPISRHVPELKDLKVCTGGTPDAAGRSREARMAIIAITTSSSMRVNP